MVTKRLIVRADSAITAVLNLEKGMEKLNIRMKEHANEARITRKASVETVVALRSVKNAVDSLAASHRSSTAALRDAINTSAREAAALRTSKASVDAKTKAVDALTLAEMRAEKARLTRMRAGSLGVGMGGAASREGAIDARLGAIPRTAEDMRGARSAFHGGARAADTYTRSVRGAGVATNSFSANLASMQSIATSLVLYRAVALFTRYVREAVSDAKKWSKVISEIRTISQDAGKSTSVWQEELVALSNSFGVSVIEAAEASYQALSNQVVKGGNAMQFLRAETELAASTVSSLDTAVSTTSSVLNAYGQSADHARGVNAILFKTVELGRLRLDELGETIGRVSILSDQLGISFVEQQASLTLLTRKGISAREASTLLRNLQLKMVKPTEKMKELFAEWGVSSGEAAIATYGFANVIKMFAAEAQSSADASSFLAEVFGRQRAITAALSLTQAGLNEEVKAFGTANQDAAAAVEETMNSMSKRADIQVQQMKNMFVEGLGKPILESFVKITEAGGGMDEILTELGRSFQTLGLIGQGVTATFRTIIWAFGQTGNETKFLIGTVRTIIEWYVAYRVASVALTFATAAYTAGQAAAGIATTRQAAATAAATLATYRYAAAMGAVSLGGVVILHALTNISNAQAQLEQDTQLSLSNITQEYDKLHRQGVAKLEDGIDKTFANILGASTAFHQGFAQVITGMSRDMGVVTAAIDAEAKEIERALKEHIGTTVRTLRDELRALRDEAESKGRKAKSGEKEIRDARLALREKLEMDRVEAERSETVKYGMLRTIRERYEREAALALKAGDKERFDALIENADKAHKELVKYNEKDKKAVEASKMIEVKRNVVEFSGRDSKGRAKFKERTIKEMVPNPVGERAEMMVLANIEAFENRRNEVIRARIRLQEDYVERQRKEAAAAEKLATAREKQFEKLRVALAEVDAIDSGDGSAENIAAMKAKIEAADKAAEEAGLSGEKRIDLLRAAYAAEANLRKRHRKEAVEADILAARKGAEDARKIFEDRVNEESAAQKKLLEETARFAEKQASDILSVWEASRKQIQGSRAQILQLEAADNQAETLRSILNEGALAGTIQERLVHIQELEIGLRGLTQTLEDLDGELFIPAGSNLSGGGAVQALVKGLTGQGFGKRLDLEQPLNQAGKAPGLLEDQRAKIQESIKNVEMLQKKEEELKKRLEDLRLEHGNVGDAAEASAKKGANALDGHIERVDVLIRKIREANQAQGALRAENGIEAPFGSVGLARAAGGIVRGTDRIPAILSPNEIVVNAQASRIFSPLLNALNNVGGSSQVSNVTNFGDINITTPNGTTDMQIEHIASELQRRQRRGLI